VHGVTAPISPGVAEQAVQWLVELQSGANEQQYRAWEQWRAADPEHERAWQRIETINQRLHGMPSGVAHQAILKAPARGRREALKLMGVLAVLAPAAWLLKERTKPWLADYHTGTGERRTVTLADGSRLDLNTNSAADVNLGGSQRQLRFIRGEILLQTASSSLPFTVLSQAGTLSTAQARFNLREQGNGCQLSVFSGAVQVRCAERPELSISVRGGQQVHFEAQQLETIVPFDESLGAWRDGMLVTSHIPLRQFLNELSRYQTGWLMCDEQIASLPISGTYPLKNIDAILDMLALTQPVRIQRRTRYWVSVQPQLA
jgi:transmembrane sensor